MLAGIIEATTGAIDTKINLGRWSSEEFHREWGEEFVERAGCAKRVFSAMSLVDHPAETLRKCNSPDWVWSQS
ncbi:hypothetical protein AGMMS50256_02930 [Betaproteobacteria bacterium]|nr:hypothetical protein AGMMS50256_02930 [Betaproteobacteria bacterium]